MNDSTENHTLLPSTAARPDLDWSQMQQAIVAFQFHDRLSQRFSQAGDSQDAELF